MAVSDKHPEYADKADDWELLDDVYAGERVVKSKGTKYLKATSGMEADGMGPGQPGAKAYEAYKSRAKFPTSFRDAVEAMVGVIHGKPPVIKLPAELESMRKAATTAGESLETLLMKITEHQLRKGRAGLLVDVPSSRGPADAVPFIAFYEAQHIINWDTFSRDSGLSGASLVVLNESGNRRQADLSWRVVQQYRVLVASTPEDSGLSGLSSGTGEGGGPPPPAGSLSDANPSSTLYQVAVVNDGEASLSGATWKTPAIAGRTLSEIPFVFVNHSDLAASPDSPPLLGLANSVMTIYRGEADYRQALFMQGQDTLVVIGWEDPNEVISEASEGGSTEVGSRRAWRVGAGASIELPIGGDAKFIGADSQGLTEMREALQNDYDDAAAQGVRIIDQAGGLSHQSGDALRTRVAAKTATLTGIAKAGAEALKQALQHAARFVGADPEEVDVVPNLEFAASVMTGQELRELMTAKQMGAPISLRSIHGRLRARNLSDMQFEEEMDEIESEAPQGTGGRGVPDPKPTGTSGNPEPASGKSGTKSGPKPKAPPV